MQLPSIAIRAEALLKDFNFLLAKPFRPEQLAFLSARISPDDFTSVLGHFGGDERRVDAALRLKAHRQHQVRPVANVLRQHMPGDIALVQPLLDQYLATCLWIVQTGGPCHVPPLGRRLDDGFGISLTSIVRIVGDQIVAAHTCCRATHRDGVASPTAYQIKLALGVLVSPQLDAVAPIGLIPVAFDQAAALE